MKARVRIQMKRLIWVAVSVFCFLPEIGFGNPITYTIDDNPANQNGYSVRGTITTDGTIGKITAVNIAGWQFAVFDSHETVVGSASSTDAGAQTAFINVDATLTTIVVPGSRDFPNMLRIGNGSGVLLWWSNSFYQFPGSIKTQYSGWQSRWSIDSFSIPLPDIEVARVQTAAVPEPSSFALLGFGSFGLAIVALRRQHSASEKQVSSQTIRKTGEPGDTQFLA